MARATFYYHLQQLQIPDKYQVIREQINDIFSSHHGRYGYRRITMELHNRSIVINHKTVERLMRENGIIYTLIRDGAIKMQIIKIS